MLRFPEAIYETTAHTLGENFYDRVEGLIVKTLPLQVAKSAKKHNLDPNLLWQIMLGPSKWTSQVANGDLVGMATGIFTNAKQRSFLNVPRNTSLKGDLPKEAVGAMRDIGSWIRNQLRGAAVKVFVQELEFAVKDLQSGVASEGEPVTDKQAEQIVVSRFIHHVNKSQHWWRQPVLLYQLQERFLS